MTLRARARAAQRVSTDMSSPTPDFNVVPRRGTGGVIGRLAPSAGALSILALVLISLAVRAGRGDPAPTGTDPAPVAGDPAPARIEPGSEKERLALQVLEQAAAPGTLAPAVGRPVERWHPVITEGIDNSAISPFEGSTFVLSNMWQSSLGSDGLVTRVWAGVDGPSSRLIIVTATLQTGIDLCRLVIELPPEAGPPRITAANSDVLTIATTNGPVFILDVAKGTVVQE